MSVPPSPFHHETQSGLTTFQFPASWRGLLAEKFGEALDSRKVKLADLISWASPWFANIDQSKHVQAARRLLALLLELDEDEVAGLQPWKVVAMLNEIHRLH